MLKNKYTFSQDSINLEIEGLPDFSKDQSDEIIGILSSWTLKISGYPDLEGNKEHINVFMDVIYTYTKFYMLGYRNTFGDANSPVKVTPTDLGHKISLISSKEGIEPLDIHIDDAELSDLIKCFDKLRADTRIQIIWNSNYKSTIPRVKRINKQKIITKLTPPILGAFIFLASSFSIAILSTDLFEQRKNSDHLNTPLLNSPTE